MTGWQTGWLMDGHPEAVDRPGRDPGERGRAPQARRRRPGHGRGQVRRLRPRHAAVGRAPRWPAARPGSASCMWPTRSSCAGPGFAVPVLSLLGSPDAPHAEAIRHDVDLTAGTAALVDQIALAAEGCGQARPAAPGGRYRHEPGRRDSRPTGPAWCARRGRRRRLGRVQIVGLWSHFACADIPGHPSIDRPAGGVPGRRRRWPSGPASGPRYATWRTARPR